MRHLKNVTVPRRAWSISELSEMTGLSRAFWRKQIRARALPSRKVGRRVLVLEADLQHYLGEDVRDFRVDHVKPLTESSRKRERGK
jgi:excisionase family DNA binding protein